MQIDRWLDIKAFRDEGSAELGDWRRTLRLVRCMESIAGSPSDSFPTIFNKSKDLEGFYRLMENPNVGWREMLSAHQLRTVQRTREAERVLIVHDTTEIRVPLRDLELRRTHLGHLSTATQGFYVHASLAVADESHAVPLGTLRIQPFIHKKESLDEETTAFWNAEKGIMDNERERWFVAIKETDEMVASPSVSPVHLMDREADSYPMLAWAQSCGYRFVLRACHLNRKVEGELKRLDNALDGLPFVAEASVYLGNRSPLRSSADQAHPPRKRRLARLHFRAAALTFQLGREESWSPIARKELPKTLTVNVVEAVELDPPDGEQPVRWLLLTSEPINAPEQIIDVVATYQKRWLIEEFFKSLKSGCDIQGRQMASASAILNVLAVLLVQAWRVLLLRSLSDENPDDPWHTVMEPLTFQLLRLEVPEAKLHAGSTVHDVMLAVASLGGHIRRNGRPGWKTLHRGWRKLADIERGARLALMLQQRKRGCLPDA